MAGVKGSAFIERSMLSVLLFLKESIFAEEYALKKGFLQAIDPRIKLASFLLLLCAAIATTDVIFLAGMYGLCLCLAVSSGIELLAFLKRTCLFVPLFSVCIVFPALFGTFSPGEPVLAFGVFVITRQGLMSVTLLLGRIIVSVSLAALLNMTTRHTVLLRVLRIVKIPQIFVLTLGMCYRYIFLFVEIIENTYLAIKSRIGSPIHYRRGQRIVGVSIANLCQRSFELNQQVYSAMLSRGYRGEPRQLDEYRVRPVDWVWACCAACVCALAVYVTILRR